MGMSGKMFIYRNARKEPLMLVHAYGAHAGDKPLEPIQIARREPGPHDVQIDIAYCGVCHSDLHRVRAEWADTNFPCVPGYEIVGRVSAVGAHVTDFAICANETTNTGKNPATIEGGKERAPR
jgi:NADPH:quinone reductase-like Zn-dependent oxidoreductase